MAFRGRWVVGAAVATIATIATIIGVVVTGGDGHVRVASQCPAADQLAFASEVDVDGDGADDLVYLEDLAMTDDPQVVVCTAAGAVLRHPGGGEYLETLDVERDGRFEILAGGTSASAAITELFVVREGRLELVTVDGEPRTWWTGLLDGWGAVGCQDVDEDGRRELVQVSIDGATWTRDAYDLDGAEAVLLSTTTGVVEGEPSNATATALTSPC